MDKKTIKQNATNIFLVEMWYQHSDPDKYSDFTLMAHKIEDKWVCELRLPLVNKRVNVVADKQVDAMLQASTEAMTLINEYQSENNLPPYEKYFINPDWEIESDSDGKVVSFSVSEAVRRKRTEEESEALSKSFNLVKDLAKKFDAFNFNGDLVIKITDASRFYPIYHKSVEEEQRNTLVRQLGAYLVMSTYDEDLGKVIAVGFTNPIGTETDD